VGRRVTTGDADALAWGVELLERAIGYTLGSLRLVTYDALTLASPCEGWDLLDLISHLDESLSAIAEAVELGGVPLERPASLTGAGMGSATGRPRDLDAVASLRDGTSRVLGAWASAEPGEVVVGGLRLATSVVASTGALEVTVHGWDIAQTCGQSYPIPPALAADLLDWAPLIVTDADRPLRFAPQRAVPPYAGPGGRLLAFVGRASLADDRGEPGRGGA
jgi:uncharacterized protein (TIGR03086 family)